MTDHDDDDGHNEVDAPATEAGGADGGARDNNRDAVAPEEDETTGYKKPPKKHQFKPGQSGNPKGRPKGAPGLRKILGKELGQKLEIREGNRRIKLSKLQVIVKRALEKAMSGDQRAIEHIIALNMQIFGLGDEGQKQEVELTLGEQLYLDAIMKRAGPLSDDEADREGDPDFHNQADSDEDSEGDEDG